MQSSSAHLLPVFASSFLNCYLIKRLLTSEKTDMEVSYGGTPKSSVFMGFSLMNHPFLGTTMYGNHHIFGPAISDVAIPTFIPGRKCRM